MRELLETCLLRDSQFGSGNSWQSTFQVITANVTIPDGAPDLIAFDATATPRTITMPTLASGLEKTIVNMSASAVLTINSAAAAFLIDLAPGTLTTLVCLPKAGVLQWWVAPGAGGVSRASLPLSTGAAPASYSTAGPQTYTAADLLTGTIVRDPNGGSRSDVTPTAAQIVAAYSGAKVGDVISTLITNGADAAEVITITAGAGVTFDANQTASSRVIGQNTSKLLKFRLTNVTPASEAVVCYT